MKAAKDYVIKIAPSVPRSYLAHAPEEFDGEPSSHPPRTTDIGLAARFTNFPAARFAMRQAMKAYPRHEFLIDVADPLSETTSTEPEEAPVPSSRELLKGYGEAGRRAIDAVNAIDAESEAAQQAPTAAPGYTSCVQPTEEAIGDPKRVYFIKGWDARGMHLGVHGSVASDDAMRTYMERIPAPAEPIDRQALADWVATRWHEAVANRPLVNVHRRSLDDTWREVFRKLGFDDVARLGPRHDDLVAAALTQRGQTA